MAAGIVFGAKVQNVVGSALGGLLPGGDGFRIYTITGSYPEISESDYRLEVSGLVDNPQTFTSRSEATSLVHRLMIRPSLVLS